MTPTISTPEIVIRDVSKLYMPISATEPFVAMQDINLEIAAGSFVAIIGPSGCGKSTLLRIVGGLEDATTGAVLHRGMEVKGPSHSRGFVFQADAVFPWLTVRRNVEFGLRSRGVPRSDRTERARHWCEAVGLRDFIGSYPKELSGGMRKRVDLARVYANDPDVLLMDEPFGALDAQTKERMQNDLLKNWSEMHKTVLFVTHDVDEAVYLADEVVVMASRPGRVAARIAIDLPRPRGEMTRVSEEFERARRQLREALRGVGH